ncbi:hypothetical protein IWX47DRAFT_864761 [Phyllosticta citricarpa]
MLTSLSSQPYYNRRSQVVFSVSATNKEHSNLKTLEERVVHLGQTRQRNSQINRSWTVKLLIKVADITNAKPAMAVIPLGVCSGRVCVQQYGSRSDFNVLRGVTSVQRVDVVWSELDSARRHVLMVLFQAVASKVILTDLVFFARNILVRFESAVGRATVEAHLSAVLNAFCTFRFIYAARVLRAELCMVMLGGRVRVVRACVG